MICSICKSSPATVQVVAVNALDEDEVRLGDPFWLPVCSDCLEEVDEVVVTVRPLGTTPLDGRASSSSNREEAP